MTLRVDDLETRVRRTTPVLALATDVFARTAWSRGRRAALALERRAVAQLRAAAAETMRSADAVAHDDASDTFVVALLDPKRADAADAELTGSLAGRLSRIERAMRASLGGEAYGGWAMATPGGVRAAIDDALMRGRLAEDRRALSLRLHDLGTPISGIAAVLSALLDGKIDLTGHRALVAAAHGETYRVGRMIRNLIALERTQFVIAEGDVGASVELAAQALSTLATERGVRVSTSVEPCTVRLDFDGLLAVFTNLIDNAIKHGRPGGIVQIGMRHEADAVKVDVDDDGPGVPAALRTQIFRAAATAQTERGSGFGLASAQALLALAGGTIDVGRSPLRGARFTVRLPRAFGAMRHGSPP